MTERMGRQDSKIFSSPPTMTESVPATAPTTPPLTGASIMLTPLAARAWLDLQRARRVGAGHFHQHIPRLHPLQETAGAEHHLFHGIRIGDDGDDFPAFFRHFFGGRSGSWAPFFTMASIASFLTSKTTKG